MRVMCVKRCNYKEREGLPDGPDVGDEDEVIGTYRLDGKAYYELERFAGEALFIAKNFATLPEQTADEMNEVEKEAIIM